MLKCSRRWKQSRSWRVDDRMSLRPKLSMAQRIFAKWFGDMKNWRRMLENRQTTIRNAFTLMVGKWCWMESNQYSGCVFSFLHIRSITFHDFMPIHWKLVVAHQYTCIHSVESEWNERFDKFSFNEQVLFRHISVRVYLCQAADFDWIGLKWKISYSRTNDDNILLMSKVQMPSGNVTADLAFADKHLIICCFSCFEL